MKASLFASALAAGSILEQVYLGKKLFAFSKLGISPKVIQVQFKTIAQ